MSDFGARQTALASKLAELREQYPSEFIKLISLADGTGGKPGVITEVSIETAASSILAGNARIATEQELSA